MACAIGSLNTSSAVWITPSGPRPISSNVIGTTTYAEVPHGQQPNGLYLFTAVFGEGLDIGFPDTPPLGPDTFGGVTYSSVNHIVTSTISGTGFDSAAAPEPGTLALLGFGIVGAALIGRRNRTTR